MTATTTKKPATFAAAIQELEMTAEDEARLEARKSEAADRGFSSVEDLEEAERKAEEKARTEPDALTAKAADPGSEEEDKEIPPWVVIPEGFKFPRGRQVGFIRFPSDWTTRNDVGLVYSGPERPEGKGFDPAKVVRYKWHGKPHRQCVLWTLSVADEKLARKAAAGDNHSLYEEMAKRCIRLIDGQVPDWSRGNFADVNVNKFWEEIGPSCRQAIVNYYHRFHTLTADQQAQFFLFGFAVRSAVTG